MKGSPAILGAISLAIAAGALIGSTITTDPIGPSADPLAELPQHKVESRTLAQARSMIAPQNHYALETPDGVVEVRDLAFHGRMRNHMREQPFYGAQSEEEAFAMAEPEPAYADEIAPASQPLPANFVPLEEGVFENAEAAPATETATADAPAPRTRFAQRDVVLQGKARMIDVDAQLGTNP